MRAAVVLPAEVCRRDADFDVASSASLVARY
jgi:hypothetical protein